MKNRSYKSPPVHVKVLERKRNGDADGPITEYCGALHCDILPFVAENRALEGGMIVDYERFSSACQFIESLFVQSVERVALPAVENKNIFKKLRVVRRFSCLSRHMRVS